MTKTWRRTITGVVTTAVLATALTACGGSDENDSTTSSAEGAGPKTVRIAYIPAIGTLPIRVGVEQGFFEKHGIELKVTEGSDIAAWTPALGKQFDIALTSPAGFLSGVNAGLPIQAITGLQESDADHLNNVMVSKTPITSLKQLEGKRVGVIAIGGGTYDSLRFSMKSAGVDASKVRFQATPVPTMLDQVKAGQLDAAISAAPFFFTADKQGLVASDQDVNAQAVEAATDGKRDVSTASFLASTKDFIAKDPETAQAFRSALQDAIAYIADNPDQTSPTLQKWLKIPAATLENPEPPLFSADLDPVVLDAWATISQTSGTLKKQPPPAEQLIWSESIAQDATR